MRGLPSALNRLQQWNAAVRQASEQAVLAAGEDALQRARSYAPVRTGRLRASIQGDFSSMESRVETRCPYAVYVEWGTRYARAQAFLGPAAREADFFTRFAQQMKEAFD